MASPINSYLHRKRVTFMSLSFIDYAMIVLYFILTIGAGVVGSRFAKTREDYLVAGRRLSFPLFFGCMALLLHLIAGDQMARFFDLLRSWLSAQ